MKDHELTNVREDTIMMLLLRLKAGGESLVATGPLLPNAGGGKSLLLEAGVG